MTDQSQLEEGKLVGDLCYSRDYTLYVRMN